jgi:hypothetical protein
VLEIPHERVSVAELDQSSGFIPRILACLPQAGKFGYRDLTTFWCGEFLMKWRVHVIREIFIDFITEKCYILQR